MSSRICKGQILSSELAGSEMLYGLSHWFDSWGIGHLIAPPKDRWNLMKEAWLSPYGARGAGKSLHNTVKSFLNTISWWQLKKAAPPLREENRFAKLEERIYLEERTNRCRLKIGDFYQNASSNVNGSVNLCFHSRKLQSLLFGSQHLHFQNLQRGHRTDCSWVLTAIRKLTPTTNTNKAATPFLQSARQN